MYVEEKQLKAFLVDSSLVAKANLEKAEKKSQKSGEKLVDVLLQEKLIDPDQLSKLQGYILGIPFVDLEKETVSSDVLRMIPEATARKNNIIAYRKTGDELEVAMLDPQDLQTIEFIKKKSGLKIVPRLTTSSSIKNALKQYQKSLESEFGELIKGETAELKAIREGAEGEEGEDLKKAAEELPIIRIVDTLLKHAIIQNASDIHIEPLEKEVVVRYRVDGILHDTMVLPRRVHSGIVARIKVLSSLKLDEHRLPQDGRFKVETEDYQVSFRVSILPVYDGEKIVMRLLPEGVKGLTLESLGILGEAAERVHQYLKKPIGMILVTGPTGSGKTTTLYAMMDILNQPGVNISTVEDPIEYRMRRINQTQVKPEIGLTFANGLRSLLRQDPDILMVGEIRDQETASLAVNASLTGHLVLSTLHTNSAAASLPRLLEMGVEPFLVASTANIIIAQRLVRKLCDEREAYTLSSKELKGLAKDVNLDSMLAILKKEKVVSPDARWEDIKFFRSKPSKDCPDGYHGRLGIYEVLEVTETIRSFILRNASPDEIDAEGRKEGMTSMLEDGFIKAVRGVTSIEEILRVTSD